MSYTVTYHEVKTDPLSQVLRQIESKYRFDSTEIAGFIRWLSLESGMRKAMQQVNDECRETKMYASVIPFISKDTSYLYNLALNKSLEICSYILLEIPPQESFSEFMDLLINKYGVDEVET